MKWWIYDKWQNFKADVKRAWLSLTIWVNGVTGAIIGALLLIPVDQVLALMPQLQPYLSSDVFRTAMVILLIFNAINAGLRFKTTKALRDK